LNTLAIGCGPIAGVATVAKVIVGFYDRRFREPQKLCHFRMIVAAESFSDIPGTGPSRIDDLIAKFEIVSSR